MHGEEENHTGIYSASEWWKNCSGPDRDEVELVLYANVISGYIILTLYSGS